MKKLFYVGTMLELIGLCIFLCACNASWITEAQAIIAAMVSATGVIAQLIALLTDSTVPATVAADLQVISSRITASLQVVSTLIAQYNATNASGTIAKINEALALVQQDAAAFLTALGVSNPALVSKVNVFIGLIVAEVQSIEAIIPILTTATPGELEKLVAQRQMNHKAFKKAFNEAISASTGDAAVDTALRELKHI